LFFDWVLDWGFKRLDHGSGHPTKPLRASAGILAARDDEVYRLKVFYLWSSERTFPPSNILLILSILTSALYILSRLPRNLQDSVK
jgi:hypothetical protein